MSRRSTQEVRSAAVDAASRLFAERGFTQTTMRDVASEAGIGLSVLYRHFSSKERLFAATFVAPFLASFEQFREDHTSAPDHEPRIDAFIRDLHHNLGTHRHALITLLAALEDPGTGVVDEVRSGLGDAWRNLQLAASGDADGATPTPDRVRDANMLVVAMVVGLALFQPWVEAARNGGDEPLVELAAIFSAAGMRAASRR